VRINKFIAQATGMSRRAADTVIENGEVTVNGQPPEGAGQDVSEVDTVVYRGEQLQLHAVQTIMLNKPVGYVVSRDGQGDRTVYELLPEKLHHLKPIGRLDKFSSGLLLLTNDGALAQELTHPSHRKSKIYEITLAQDLAPLHRQMISDHGVMLDDGPSKLELERLNEGNEKQWRILMREGRNRQIRRTFLSLGYGISSLQRVQFGDYTLKNLVEGKYRAA
jgi:23S rRNA pseudouridine2605 synthase